MGIKGSAAVAGKGFTSVQPLPDDGAAQDVSTVIASADRRMMYAHDPGIKSLVGGRDRLCRRARTHMGIAIADG